MENIKFEIIGKVGIWLKIIKIIKNEIHIEIFDLISKYVAQIIINRVGELKCFYG